MEVGGGGEGELPVLICFAMRTIQIHSKQYTIHNSALVNTYIMAKK